MDKIRAVTRPRNVFSMFMGNCLSNDIWQNYSWQVLTYLILWRFTFKTSVFGGLKFIQNKFHSIFLWRALFIMIRTVLRFRVNLKLINLYKHGLRKKNIFEKNDELKIAWNHWDQILTFSKLHHRTKVLLSSGQGRRLTKESSWAQTGYGGYCSGTIHLGPFVENSKLVLLHMLKSCNWEGGLGGL